jgi:hypothetical protein
MRKQLLTQEQREVISDAVARVAGVRYGVGEAIRGELSHCQIAEKVRWSDESLQGFLKPFRSELRKELRAAGLVISSLPKTRKQLRKRLEENPDMGATYLLGEYVLTRPRLKPL